MTPSAIPPGAEVDPTFVANQLSDPSVRIVEVDVSSASYLAGHIPGAVLWNAYTDLRHPDYQPISASELQDLLRRSGIAADTTVVVYGYGSHLGYWLLRSCGHDLVRLLDGPRERWSDAGHDWSSDIPGLTMSPFEGATQSRFIASRNDVQALMESSGGTILDVRTRAEYLGHDFWPSGAPEEAGRAGHIPGAIHLPVDSLRTSAGVFKDRDELQRVVQEYGLDPAVEIITYCTIGNRASQVWYALTALGYADVSVYYGSWVEWGMAADAPIETG